MPETALITGATGTVGSQVVRTLTSSGVRALAFVRDVDKARAWLGNDAALVVGDLGDFDLLRDALSDVDALFLACGNVPDQIELECRAIDAAASAGVRRVVKLSARGAERTATPTIWRGHAAIEDHLAASQLPAVILRPSFYMTNLLAAAAPVRLFRTLPAPAGTAPIAMIDPNDIVKAAARVMFDDRVTGVLHLTGPEPTTYHSVAAQLTDILGRDITYLDVSSEQATQSMVTNGIPEPAAKMILEVFAALRRGAYATTTDTVPRLLGRPSGSVAEFLRRHAAAFADLVVQ